MLAASCVSAAPAQSAFALTVPTFVSPPPITGAIDDAWSKAEQLPVQFDFTYQRSGEPATVYVAQDAHALDLAFVVTQHTPITESTTTNGAGVMNDDNVTVDLWPQGANGFKYTFSANATGARYQTSSENSAYSPQWSAAGRRTASGYVVTMRIPFSIMRTGGSTSWKAQFERTIQATNSTQVWAHVQGQRNSADVAFAGTLSGVDGANASRAGRVQPRLQIYALGEATTPVYGRDTSRIGADLALPVTATSSLVASFHPDYSNVEIDQQTISPSAFPRFYSEVRPFFTQLSHNFNNTFGCNNCPTMLYTPAIPTFRDGYAYEGAQGPFTFAAYDASGNQRTDDAQAVSYTVNDAVKIAQVAVQRVGVHTADLDDTTTSLMSGYEWQKSHAFVYFNTASVRGSAVTTPSQANYLEFGLGHVSKDTTYGWSYQKVGAQFLPADGFVQQPDVIGWNAFVSRTIHFDPKSTLQDIQFGDFLNEQNDHSGKSASKFDAANVNFDFRNQFTLHVFGGFQNNETFDGQYLPFNQNGLFLGYKTQTSTPTSVEYAGGSYYHGSLSTWSYVTTRALTRRIKLSLEADENTYAPGGTYVAVEPTARQWLERASLDFQFSRYASFDVGARRIVGRNLPNAFEAPTFDELNDGNVSAAFHFLAAHNEWYVVYGNPNYLSTLPAFYVKWIRYIGAEKGT